MTTLRRRLAPLLVRGRRLSVPPTLTALLVAVLAWELVGRVAQVSFFPPISAVVLRLVELVAEGAILPSLAGSLRNLAIGFSIASVAGVTIGVLMGLSWRVEAALDMYVYALLTTPSLIFAPVFFTIFGLGQEVVIALIVLYSILYVIVGTMTAIRSAPAPVVEMAKSYGANRWQIFVRIRLPAAIPLLMAAFLVAAPIAVKGMINGEMFIAVFGLGEIVTRAGGRFDATTVLAILLIVIALAFASIEIVRAVDRRLTGWLPPTARAQSMRG